MTLTPALKRIRNLTRELAADFRTRATRHDADRTAPVENYRLLREAHLYALAIPERFGGLGFGMMGWAVAGEELAQGCPSTAFAFAAHVAATGLIMEEIEATNETRQRVADRIIHDGTLLTAPVYDPAIPLISARRAPGGYRLTGRIPLVVNWEASDLALVPVRFEETGERMAMLVPTASDSLTVQDVWHTLGLRAARNQAVVLDGTFTAAENLVGAAPECPPAWAYLPGTIACLGIGAGILNQTKLVLATRQVTGDAERRLAQMTCDLEGARRTMREAALLQMERAAANTLTREVFMARYLTCTAVAGVSRSTVVAIGTRSLLQDLGMEQLIRDAVTAASQAPDEDQCLSLIGKLELGGLCPTACVEEGRKNAAL